VVNPLGFVNWEIRAGHTYEMLETGPKTIMLHDTAGKQHTFKISGATTMADLVAEVQTKKCIPEWEQVIIKRADGKPFWIEDKGTYTLVTIYDESRDNLLHVTVRFDAVDRTYISEEFRFDPAGEPQTPFDPLFQHHGRVTRK
jgi:hypothetical protein